MGALLSVFTGWMSDDTTNEDTTIKQKHQTLQDKIAQFEHDAQLADCHRLDCIAEASGMVKTGNVDGARQRFAHAQSYRQQNSSLMRAVTAMHAQRLSIDTHANNMMILETLKQTARQVHHQGIDPDMVDAVTERLTEANDYAAISNGVMSGLGDELAPPVDDEWETFLSEQTGAGVTRVNTHTPPIDKGPTAGALEYAYPAAPTAVLPPPGYPIEADTVVVVEPKTRTLTM